MDIILPGDGVNDEVTAVLAEHEGLQLGYLQCKHTILCSPEFLKTLFIVSDASVLDEGSTGTTSSEWVFTGSVNLKGKRSS